MVVTSRIVGYRNTQLPGGDAGYRHFTLSPFDEDEIAHFAQRWYEAIRSKGEVLAQLLERLGDEEDFVRSAAAEALGRLGASAATKEILDVLGKVAYAAGSRWTSLGNAAFRALSELLTYYHPGGE